MKFSIIIPAYKAEKFIRHCLDSLMSQDFPSKEYEIIVVDDCSPDGQNDVIRSLSNSCTSVCEIKLIKHQENKRQGGARNTGIAAAQGEWIMFMDADDFWCDDKVLKNFVRIIDLNEDADIVESISHTDVYDLNLLPETSNFDMKFEVYSGVEFYISEYYSGYVWRSAYRRDFIKNIKFRENVFFEDSDFRIRAVLGASKVVKIDYPFYAYVNNSESTIRSNHLEVFIANISCNKIILDLSLNFPDERVMAHSIDRLKSNVFSWLKISKNFPLMQSCMIFKYAKHEGLLDLRLYSLSEKERVVLAAMKYAPLTTATSIKAAVHTRRLLRKAVKIF